VCAVCGVPFEVFPCLDRIQCCSRKCSAQLKGQKLRGPRLPAVRACKCGRVERLLPSECAECRNNRSRESYHRNKQLWSEEQRERRRAFYVRQDQVKKQRCKEDDEYRKTVNLRTPERGARRRAKIAQTKVERISYKKLLERFGMVCSICTLPILDGELSFDHVMPLAKGGGHTMDNIRPAHMKCNRNKGAKLPEECACLCKAW
jgi:5-methylcytosine-specific restriction endonuclease McrA